MSDIEHFRKFIEKVYLNNEIDKAIIVVEDGVTTCNVFIQHRMFGCDVVMDNNVLNVDNTKIAVVNMEVLYKMIKAFPEDIEILYKTRSSKAPHHLRFQNDMIQSQFILGKERAVDNYKKLNLTKIKDWLFDLDFTDYLDQYRSYENVLKSYETFYFSNERGSVQLNFGGLKQSSENIITIDLKIKPDVSFSDTILFNKNLFNEAIKANKESKMHLRVSKKLYELSCEEDNFTAKYYNTKSKNQ